MLKPFFVIVLAVFSGGSLAQSVYKCIDDQGKPVFSQQPCADDAETVDIGPTNSSEPPSEEMNRALRERYRMSRSQSITRSVERSSGATGSSSEACRYSRNVLQKYEMQWKSKRRRGYTVADENRYTDLIATWNSNVNIYCD